MSISELITSVRQLIAAADTGRALQTLITFLQSDKRYRSLLRAALGTQALFAQTRQRQQAGTLSEETATTQYNLVNDTTLRIVEAVDRGELEMKDLDPRILPPKRPAWVLPVVLTALLVLAAGVGTWIYFAIADRTASCPSFQTKSKFNVLLLPFQNISGNVRPEITIQSRLDELAQEKALDSDVAVYSSFFKKTQDLPGYSEAQQICRECKADLIVWGTAEQTSSDLIVSTRFKYLKGRQLGNNFEFRKLKLEGESQVSNIQSLTTLAREGGLTQDIEQIILWVFGLVAFEQGHFEESAAALQQVNTTSDSMMNILKNMVIADSYLATDNQDSALAAYNRLLTVHPNYAFALSNRGLLLYQKQQYDEAAVDFSNALRETPDNPDLLLQRSATYYQMENLDSAEVDLRRAEALFLRPDLKPENEISPESRREVPEWKEKIESKRRYQREIIEQTSNDLRANPNDPGLLSSRAIAKMKLGENESALMDARQAYQIDPNSTQVQAALLESLARNGKDVQLERAVDRIENNPATANKLIQEYPRLERIITVRQQ